MPIKPLEVTDWATSGAALKDVTDSSRWTLGWQTLPDNLPTQTGERPNLNQQNYWQFAVHQWITFFNTAAVLTTRGDILSINAAEEYYRIPAGAEDQILRANADGDPVFEDSLGTTTRPGFIRAPTIAQVYLASNMTALNDSQSYIVTWDTVVTDDDSIFAANSFTPILAGWYRFSFSVDVSAGAKANVITTSSSSGTVNGQSILGSTGEVDANGNKVSKGSKLIHFNGTSDSINVSATMDTTGTQWSITAGQSKTYMEIELVRAD